MLIVFLKLSRILLQFDISLLTREVWVSREVYFNGDKSDKFDKRLNRGARKMGGKRSIK